MTRQRLAPGEWGKIKVTKSGPKFVAKARCRDSDGVLRPVEASGPSADAASRNLTAKLRDRVTPATGTEVTRNSTVSELADRWFQEQRGSLSQQSYNTYLDNWIKLCAPAIGQLLVREIRTGKIDSFLLALAARAPSSARTARVVCTGVFAKGVRLDLLPTNPVREVALPPRKRTPIRSVTREELEEIRRRVACYCRHEVVDPDGSIRSKSGPKPGQDLQDIMDLLMGTACRISEVLALVEDDANIESDPVTVIVRATLIVPRVAGERLRRQAYRKGGSPPLTVTLPDFAVQVLRRRRAQPKYINPHNAVFVTSTGNWVSPSNVRRSWRAALGPEFSWVTPHSFRRTVATIVKEKYGVETAQSQLGHSSSRVTEAHYIEKTYVAPDLTEVLDRFRP